MSHPANRLPPEYDDYQPQDYDPAYTADISTMMRVPERIAVSEHDRTLADAYNQQEIRRSAAMNVPDRIVVVGQEQHAGLRAHIERDIDSLLPSYVGLATPPRVLTLGRESFPDIPDVEEACKENGGYTSLNNSMMLRKEEPVDAVEQLHDQVTRLTTRIMLLEEDRHRRAARELILYPVVLGYCFLKVLGWIMRLS